VRLCLGLARAPWLALSLVLCGHLPPCSQGASALLCKLDWASLLLLALLWAKIGLVISLFFYLILTHFRYISM
jgi:hypothetical protein